MSAELGIARTILSGFDKHYRLFREISARARQHFEAADWETAWQENRQRIRMYEQRVRETVAEISDQHPESGHDSELWPSIKRHYISLLLDHLQAECAETFFNSVACRVLHRSYYHNQYIFWRPAMNTGSLAGERKNHHSYYPATQGLRRCVLNVLAGTGLAEHFDDLRRDVRRVEQALNRQWPEGWRHKTEDRLQVLDSLFYRNKAAYVVGRQVTGDRIRPLILPILRKSNGRLFIDAALTRRKDAAVLFSFTRAYFMTEMEVPSAYVSFLNSIMPTKSPVDLYAILGLQKHAKTMFYREMIEHLDQSEDNYQVAPGIPGTVMLVFTLPSFPFVIKVIKDRFDPPKVTNHQHVRDCYTLVKFHDRVGRLADTLEYSNVAIPLARIEPELMKDLQEQAAGSMEIDGEMLVIRHCYIERRMIPLNQFLAQAAPGTQRRIIDDYGNAIRDLAGANIFPGDMMQKNFGVTRQNRVVFYDYDEICYLTDCRFRTVPDTDDYFDATTLEPSFSMDDHDVFPETFGPLFFPNPRMRDAFARRHAELMTPGFWKSTQAAIQSGEPIDVFPYPRKRRFRAARGAERASGTRDRPGTAH